MHHLAQRGRHSKTPSPFQQGVLWLVLQAVLALTLAAGARAISGPLHWHDGAGDHHTATGMPGEVARHQHNDAADVVPLESGAAPADDLSTSTAALNAAATLWPVQLGSLKLTHSEREPWAAPPRTVAWSDTDPWPLEHRPRG